MLEMPKGDKTIDRVERVIIKPLKNWF